MYTATTATRKLAKLNKRIRCVSGGTSASKTISILLLLIDYAQSVNNELISVVSESFPHLKRGAIRDFQNIMETHGYWNPKHWNKTDYTYQFGTTKMEFFSADQPGKVRGPRRHVLFINEANNIPYETFDQLEVRTSKIIWADWNPVSEFWFYTELLGKRDDVEFITLTYKDNDALEKSIVKSIESHKHNKNWWRVYGEGQLGEVEGRVYRGWEVIDSLPEDARLVRYGLDFGYTNDPTSIVGIYKYNNGLILDEVIYRKGLLNSEIAKVMNLRDKDAQTLIIADSAEPKSIDELAIHGLNIIPSVKGPGSVLQGIQSVQDKHISVTKQSTNVLKEYRNYLWDTDRDGKTINKPTPVLDHALDAIRYAITDLYPIDEKPKEEVKDARIPGTYVKSIEDSEDGDFYTDRTNDWGI